MGLHGGGVVTMPPKARDAVPGAPAGARAPSEPRVRGPSKKRSDAAQPVSTPLVRAPKTCLKSAASFERDQAFYYGVPPSVTPVTRRLKTRNSLVAKLINKMSHSTGPCSPDQGGPPDKTFFLKPVLTS